MFYVCTEKKRSISLQNYFLRESKLWADCKTFIADLLLKGYMQKSVGASAKKNAGIYHINVNKEKMRIFFDCSSKFNCWSLNCDLKSGPDNLPSSVPVRCRREQVASMGDIESRFFQIKVAEEHCTVFKAPVV